MKRIAIVGPSGAGKSTLARELGRFLNIKFYHLDRIFWKRGWEGMSEDTRMDILQKIVEEEQWIIEGSYFSLTEPSFEKADTIIFLDMPPFLCIHRLIERHRKNRDLRRRDNPIDSTDKLSLKLFLRVFCFSMGGRKRLMRKLEKYEKDDETKIIKHLRSPEDVKVFLVSLNGTGAITTLEDSYTQQKALLHYSFRPREKAVAGSKR